MSTHLMRALALGLALGGLRTFGAAPITEAQRLYLEDEVIAIVHWGLNTYTGNEWGDGTTNPSTALPQSIGDTIDPVQWAQSMKAGGIRKVILVAKHHDGFCLWPATEATNDGYSTAALPDGHSFKGYNLVERLNAACEQEGLKFGVYISPWDRHHANWALEDGVYTAYFHSQVKHMIDTYPITEMWFDGATGDGGYYGGANETRKLPRGAQEYYSFPEILSHLKEKRPTAVVFGGGSGNSVCWSGNEEGHVPEGGWTYDRGGWFGAPEADTPVGGNGQGKGQWFWHPGHAPKPLKQMVRNYFESVGRGGVLNWGIAPDQSGRVPEADARRLKEFGDFVAAFNASDVFAGATVSTETFGGKVQRLTTTLELTEAKEFNAVDFGEVLTDGQKVTRWTVEARADGAWRELSSGTLLGYRRIVRIGGVTSSETVTADAVRITAYGDALPALERIHVRMANVVKDDGSVEIGGTDTEEWMEKDEEGYNVIKFAEGTLPTFNLPSALSTYEVEIKLDGLTDKDGLTVGGYPQVVTIQGADGKSLSVSVNAEYHAYEIFLTGSGLHGTREGTLVGAVGGNGDVGSTDSWTTADGKMKLVLRNDGTTLSLYKNDALILKTDKNFSNGGKVRSMTVGTGLASLNGGRVVSVRYREAEKAPVEELLANAYLWLDASETATLLRSDAGAVTNWASRAGGRSAKAYAGMEGPEVAAQALAGKDVVDFGAAGSGKDLEFDRTTTVRTVFMVAALEAREAVFMLGDASSYNFHRGTNGEYLHASHGSKFVNGTYRNGCRVASPAATVPPTDFGLVTLVADSDAAAGRICQDRAISGRHGGKKVAELVVFNHKLTDVERSQVEGYLMEKWLGDAYYTATAEGDANWSQLVWKKGGVVGTPGADDVVRLVTTGRATVKVDADVAVGGILGDSYTLDIQEGRTLAAGDFLGALAGTGVLKVSAVPSASLLAKVRGAKWRGTLFCENVALPGGVELASWGHAGSRLKFTGCSGWIGASTVAAEVVLEDAGETKALTISDASSGAQWFYGFRKISGTGTLKLGASGTQDYRPVRIEDVGGFSGVIETTRQGVIVGRGATDPIILPNDGESLSDCFGKVMLLGDTALTVRAPLAPALLATDADGYVVRETENAGDPKTYTYRRAKTATPAAPAEVVAATEAEALGQVVVTFPAGAAQAGQQALFEAGVLRPQAREGAAGTWTVSVVIDKDRLPPGQRPEDAVAAFAAGEEGLGKILKVAAGVESVAVEIPAACATAGLYYSLVYSDDLSFAVTGETPRVLSGGQGPVLLVVPVTDAKTRFFKVKASLVAE